MSETVIIMISISLKPCVSDRRVRCPSALFFSVAAHVNWAWVVTCRPQTPLIFLLFHSFHTQSSTTTATATATSIPTNQNQHQHQQFHHNFSVSSPINIDLGSSFTYLLPPEEESFKPCVPRTKGPFTRRRFRVSSSLPQSRRRLFTDLIYRFKIQPVDQRRSAQ